MRMQQSGMKNTEMRFESKVEYDMGIYKKLFLSRRRYTFLYLGAEALEFIL